MSVPRAPKVSVDELHAAVKGQPLVGVKAAAGILGIAIPNFKRYRHRLRVVPIEGSSDAFVRSEVQALAKDLAKERRA